jgi:hyperosmotically inducible periplasmic protein
MAERQTESRRVVVETPNARRETVHTEAARYPDRSGVSGAALAAIVVGVIVLAAIIILFVMNQNNQNTANANVAQQQPPQTTIVQQPAQQPPVIVQQPVPATQPAPVIINGAPTTATGGATITKSSGPDDGATQSAIDKKLNDDPALSSLGITATVLDGKATLMGSVKTQALKNQVERVVRNVKGVKSVDNQISVG